MNTTPTSTHERIIHPATLNLQHEQRPSIRKTRRLRTAGVLCFLTLLLTFTALPGMAETLTTGNVIGASGSVGVTTSSVGLDWNGLPQNNPNQVTVASDSTGTGAFYTNLNFVENPSTEYGVTWAATNDTGQTWRSMHFTISYAPLDDFSVTYDAGEGNGNNPGSIGFGAPANWTDTNIDFYGALATGSTATFFLPIDVNGLCCHGNFVLIATPDYQGATPEPSSLLLLGSGVLGLGGMLRRRLLG